MIFMKEIIIMMKVMKKNLKKKMKILELENKNYILKIIKFKKLIPQGKKIIKIIKFYQK